jgi:hypothetical protein
MLKKIAFAVALLCSIASAQQTAGTTTGTAVTLDPTQVYNTGNLVVPTTTTSGSTWANGVYQDQLTCFAYGNPGYCGPSPIVRPGGNINFSYGMTDLYQVHAISSVLPNNGTGLRVNGYTYGFTAKNGNGWDNGQQDYLSAYVSFMGSDGKEAFYKGYDLNSKFEWTTFSWSETFATPFASKDLSTVRYGIMGYDTNFWAGPYGPEVMNVNFSLKYSVDACAVDVLSSPTCPGYTDALMKLIPATVSTNTVDPITTTSTSPTATTTVTVDPVSPTVAVTTTSTVAQPSVVAAVVSAPAPTTTTTTSTSTAATASATSQTKETNTSSNTSLALSLISKNQDKEKEIAMTASQNAIQAAEQAGAQAQQEAVSIASQAVANSITAGGAAVRTDGSSSSNRGGGASVAISADPMSQTTQVNQSMGLGPTQTTSAIAQQQEQVAILAPAVSTTQVTSMAQIASPTVASKNESNKTSTFETPLLAPAPAPTAQKSQTVIQTANTPQPVNTVQTIQEQQSTATIQTPYTLLPPQQPVVQSYVAPTVSYELFTATPTQTLNTQTVQNAQETNTSLSPNFLTDRTNPLTDIIEAKQQVPQNSTIATVGPSVNKNVGNNEVAGGVDINKMALAPTGYGDYMNFTLKDAAFYAPKEVYRNQRNVDNARALRQMTNDSKHREMIEMQYVR